MSKKIILAFPPIDDEKEHHHIPVSLLALAAPLEAAKIDYEIWDQRVDSTERLDHLLKDAWMLGLTMFTGYQTYRGYEILQKAKIDNPNLVTIVGGPHVTALPLQTAEDPYVDYAVEGFGESTFLRFVIAHLEHGHIEGYGIPGLYRFQEDEIRAGTHAILPASKKFDTDYWEPLPYHKLDLSKYINPETGRAMYVAHYGCPARCTFCATGHYRKWTAKPLEIVGRDLQQLYNLFPFKQICFFDATLFTRKERVRSIIDLLDPYGGVKWMADARAVELNKYTLDDLIEIRDKKAELLFLIVGLETGSTYIAEEIMKKGRKHLEMFRKVAGLLREADIKLISGLIFGIPGETPDDVRKTIDFVSDIRDINPGFRLSSTFFRPLPGTELYDLLDNTGYIAPKSLEEWAEYGARSHFRYNEWMDIPWMAEATKDKYRVAYEDFLMSHGDILTG